MSFLAMLSTLAIIAAVAIIAAAFITGTTTETYSPATLSVPPQSFLSGYTNIANIIFAFQGQSEFYEMMGEMKNPKKFPLSLGVAQIVMVVMYLFTAVLAYHYGGADVNGFVLYSLPTNRLRTVCALLIAIHIVGECAKFLPSHTRISRRKKLTASPLPKLRTSSQANR